LDSLSVFHRHHHLHHHRPRRHHLVLPIPAATFPTATFPTATFPTATFPTATFPTATFPTATFPTATLIKQEEKQLVQLSSSSADAQREARLRTELEGSEEALVGLREQMRVRNAKLRTTQELLDEREAEVYELEEQVQA
jgi:hypothetical protein